MEVLRVVGTQGYATVTDWEYYGASNPLSVKRTVQASELSIRLYEARVVSNDPYWYNTRVLLKEFLTDARALAVTEAEAYKSLYADAAPRDVPVPTLLGTFIADDAFAQPGFAIVWEKRFPSVRPPKPGAPFLVFRWEGMLTGINAAKSVDGEAGVQWFNALFEGALIARKTLYAKTFMKKALQALSYLHANAGIVHRSLGLASIMVNTTEHRLASSLDVKIRDLGFATRVSELVAEPHLERARKAGAVTPQEIAMFYFAEDVYALGYAFLEYVFTAFGKAPVTQDTFKKLLEDTFKFDVEQFRAYCLEDPDWTLALELLDLKERAGWELVKSMLLAKENFRTVATGDLAKLSFLNT